jgi:hypothetical protein
MAGVCVPTYRLYRLDGAGKISAAGWIEAADDDAARREAEAGAEIGGYEIWNRKRLVARAGPKTA